MDSLHVATGCTSFTLGACVGSFLNVVIYRIPAGLSLLWPPSRCPHCLHQLGKRENIPILGWLWLHGKCRHCRAPISIRYPTIELITGLLFLATFWEFGGKLGAIDLVRVGGYSLFLSWLLSLSLIDIDTMTLPGTLTKFGVISGLAYQVISGLFQPNRWLFISHQIIYGIAGAVIGMWSFEIVKLLGAIVFKKDAMGEGDPRLAAGIGMWLGWKLILFAGFFANIFAALFGITAMLVGRMKFSQKFPFGPYIALGGAFSLFFGESLIAWYLQKFIAGS
jgi:leader peptidase (prepilin peptidase)/N-methyltransferase